MRWRSKHQADEVLDPYLLQRIRQHLSGRLADHPLHEVLIQGVRAARLNRHLRHLLDSGEIRGRLVRSRHGEFVLVRGGLTPSGLVAFLDASATELEQQQTLGAQLRKLMRSGRSGIADVGWKIIAAIGAAGALVWLGLGG
jgi:hypothetical protein